MQSTGLGGCIDQVPHKGAAWGNDCRRMGQMAKEEEKFSLWGCPLVGPLSEQDVQLLELVLGQGHRARAGVN